MALLIGARLLVAAVPMARWRRTLGSSAPGQPEDAAAARRLAVHVERAAGRLPVTLRCLPRAIALSWLLRRAGIAHHLVIAARPAGQRDAEDALHAWIESDGVIVLGELPGPWLTIATL